jgi:transcription termination factor NusA
VKEPLARNFFRMGFRTIEEIADASIDELTGASDLADDIAEKLRDAAIAIVDGEPQA